MRSSWIVAGLVVVIAGGATAAVRRPAVRQPIAFNHAKHIAAGADCTGCHGTAEEQAAAGMPDLDTCMQCHDEPMSKSPEEKKLRVYAGRHEAPPWQRVYREPPHVFFSHRRHVVVAKVACDVCHGAMARAVEPPSRPFVNQTMSWCLQCHQKRHAATDCIACHK